MSTTQNTCQQVNSHGEKLRWKVEALGTCIYSTYDIISFIVGWMSVASWTFALLPQIITNFLNKGAESQSFWFWLLWVIGDLCNLSGCILTQNLITNIALAFVYFVFTLIAFLQFVFYEKITSKSIKKIHSSSNSPSNNNINITTMTPQLKHSYDLLKRTPHLYNIEMNLAFDARKEFKQLKKNVRLINSAKLTYSNSSFPKLSKNTSNSNVNKYSTPQLSSSNNYNSNMSIGIISSISILTLIYNINNINNINNISRRFLLSSHSSSIWNILNPIGIILGWVSSIIYISSRIPQLILMVKSKDVEGINPLFFILTCMGNVTQSISMLVDKWAWHKPSLFMSILPWLTSASICMFQDFVILILIFLYRNRRRNKDSQIYDIENAKLLQKKDTIHYGTISKT